MTHVYENLLEIYNVYVLRLLLSCWDLGQLTFSIPVPRKHDVVVMKLLPAVVLPRASVLVAVPVSDVVSTVVGAAGAFWPVEEESGCDSAVVSGEEGVCVQNLTSPGRVWLPRFVMGSFCVRAHRWATLSGGGAVSS